MIRTRIFLIIVASHRFALATDPALSVVAVFKSNKFICEGGILGPNLVVTTCKCITVRVPTQSVPMKAHADEFTVACGLNDLNKLAKFPGVVVPVSSLAPHKNCRMRNLLYENDIGLVHLSRNISYGLNIQPLRPPHYNRNYKLKHYMFYLGTKTSSCQISGYGLTLSASKQLSTANISLLPFDHCRTALCHVGFVSLCPLDLLKAKRSCGQLTSDSMLCVKEGGAPVTCDGGLVGVVSQGPARWLKHAPGTSCMSNKPVTPFIVSRLDSYELEEIFPVAEENPKSLEISLAPPHVVKICFITCYIHIF